MSRAWSSLACYDMPDDEAIAGDLVSSCNIEQACLLGPFFPPYTPPGFDFGCYPMATPVVNFALGDPPAFSVGVYYPSSSDTGFCAPTLSFYVRMPSGSACGGLMPCFCATTDDIDLLAVPGDDIDGVPYADYQDKPVLVWQQADPTQNGIYVANSAEEEWQPYICMASFEAGDIGKVISAARGDSNGLNLFMVTDENTVEKVAGGGAGNATVLVATTENVAGLSVSPGGPDTPTIDGVDSTALDGQDILVWLQTDPFENGIWTYDAAGDPGARWVKKSNIGATDVGIMINTITGLRWGEMTFEVRGDNMVLPLPTLGVIPCQGATVGNHALSGLFTSSGTDNVQPTSGDLWMVWQQTPTPSENGVYVALSGTWRKLYNFCALDATYVVGSLRKGQLLSVWDNPTAGASLYKQSMYAVLATNTIIGMGAYYG